MKPLSLYVHIPFCKSKCIYCDFKSMSGMESVIDMYIDSVIKEIQTFSNKANEYIVKSIFIGGGTPSVIPPEYIFKLQKVIRSCFNIDANAEITIETNPGTIDKYKLDLYKDSGINRLSIGVQSFSQKHLEFIGRAHNTSDVYRSYKDAKDAGFENINIDLIFCLPEQTLNEWLYTLYEAIELSANHISAYSLILEEGTKLYKMYKNGDFKTNDEDLDRQMYESTKNELIKNGWFHYEISNFAKKGFECFHNLNYWDCGEYAGFGIAAHSYFQNYRYGNIENIYEYIELMQQNQTAFNNSEFIDTKEQMSEFMFLGLRKINGVSETDFSRKFNITLDNIYQAQIKKFISLGLMARSNGYIRLTDNGIDVSNIIFSEFLL